MTNKHQNYIVIILTVISSFFLERSFATEIPHSNHNIYEPTQDKEEREEVASILLLLESDVSQTQMPSPLPAQPIFKIPGLPASVIKRQRLEAPIKRRKRKNRGNIGENFLNQTHPSLKRQKNFSYTRDAYDGESARSFFLRYVKESYRKPCSPLIRQQNFCYTRDAHDGESPQTFLMRHIKENTYK